jgi:hypothetical protein
MFNDYDESTPTITVTEWDTSSTPGTNGYKSCKINELMQLMETITHDPDLKKLPVPAAFFNEIQDFVNNVAAKRKSTSYEECAATTKQVLTLIKGINQTISAYRAQQSTPAASSHAINSKQPTNISKNTPENTLDSAELHTSQNNTSL